MAITTFSGPVVSQNGFVAEGSLGMAALLGDIANVLNTQNKQAGKQVVDLDTGLIYTSVGAATNSNWLASSGAATITPA